MNTEGVFDIFLNVFKLNWLISQLTMYIYLFVAIAFIQNIFLIIIGDGYVKSKYFHKNNWVKVDEDPSIIKRDEEEDPLEVFYDDDPQAHKSTKALVKMLKFDKEILMQEYYQSKGIDYQVVVESEGKQIKSFEKLARLTNTQIDKTAEAYNESIGSDEVSEDEKESQYDVVNKAVRAMQHKLNQLKSDID